MSKADEIREAFQKEERSKADWRPQASAPYGTLVLACVKKGKMRCPGRPDMYVTPAIRSEQHGWVLFGLPPANQRPGETIEFWMPLPELPEGATEADKHHKDHLGKGVLTGGVFEVENGDGS